MELIIASMMPGHGIALIVSLVIFVISLSWALKRVVPFVLTLILLFFAFVSGIAVLKNELVQDFMKNQLNVDVNQYSSEDFEFEGIREKSWEAIEKLIDILSNSEPKSPQSTAALKELREKLQAQTASINALIERRETAESNTDYEPNRY
ncbi:MAG: hypothetical protein KDK40_02650 [Chlamydiia bacterium]|nr:hypothetical protein [Chlamydiia bacterium]